MKTINFFKIGLLVFAVSSSQAQVNVNVNIGKPPPVVVVQQVVVPPQWGPVGYDNTEYYYIPDIQTYYDIRSRQYIYNGNGNWIRSRNLPSQHRNYNLYNGYKVVLTDYHGRTPYMYYNTHKVKYYKGYKGKPQKNRGKYYYKHDDDHDDDDHDKHHHHDKRDYRGKEDRNHRGHKDKH